jgi:hypothetical protein
MAFRTRFSREAVANLTLALEDRNLKKLAEDKEEFTKARENMPPGSTPELRERARQALLSGDIKLTLVRGGNTEDHLMGLQLATTKALGPILGGKYWHILETNMASPFITSDHPVVTLPSPSHRPGMSVGYADGWILFPLSPQRAVLITNKRYSKKTMMVTQEKMREYRWYIITRCYQSVFSHSVDRSVQKILDKTEEGEVIRVYLPKE